MRVQQNVRLRRLAVGVVVLLAAAFVLLLAARASIRADEAWMAWAVHYDPIEATGQIPTPDTLRDVLVLLRDDVQQAVERAHPAGLPTLAAALLLNTWVLLAGDSELALRLPVILLVLVAVSVAVRLLWTRRVVGVAPGAAVLVLASMIAVPLLTPATDWRAFLEQIAERRRSTDAALVAWPPDSIIAYYERRLPLRTGISIDVGWRAFSTAEIDALLTRLETRDVIWFLLYDQPETIAAVQAYLARDRSLLGGYRETLEGFIAWRYVR